MRILGAPALVASLGVVASSVQGASYCEKDRHYARDEPAHKEASRWAGKGATAPGLARPVDPDAFCWIFEGKVPDGPHLGRRTGTTTHRLTLFWGYR